MTEYGYLGAFITKVKRGSIADTVAHLKAGKEVSQTGFQPEIWVQFLYLEYVHFKKRNVLCYNIYAYLCITIKYQRSVLQMLPTYVFVFLD